VVGVTHDSRLGGKQFVDGVVVVLGQTRGTGVSWVKGEFWEGGG